MCRAVLVWIVVGFLAPSLLFAESYPLKYKKIKVNKKSQGVLPELELSSLGAFAGENNEPRYKSDNPQRFESTFGNGNAINVVFAVDERRGTGKGFDVLYVDTNGSGNLAKGKKYTGKNALRGYSYEDTTFPIIEVAIPDGEGVMKIPVQARFSVRKDTPSESSLYLTPLSVMEGAIAIGEKKLKMIVFDANCNGIYGEKAELRGSTSSGDRIWIGTGSPKVEKAYIEAFPLGKYYQYEDNYYEIEFLPDNSVEIKKSDITLGRMRVNNPGFILELVGNDSVLFVNSDKENEISVPAGNYRINNAGFRRKYKGAIWELQGKAGTFQEQFKIKEEETTEINVGAPLKIAVNTTTRMVGNGMVASLAFSIMGGAGETYQYLLKDGKKVDLPEVLIKNPSGKVVQTGHFEYG